MDWEEGRQHTGYFKKLIRRSTFPIGHDILLLKYPKGARIPWHLDPVEGKKHYRMNVELNSSFDGGNFETEHDVMFSMGPVNIFRPDKNKHRVTEVTDGTRYLFSVGVAF